MVYYPLPMQNHPRRPLPARLGLAAAAAGAAGAAAAAAAGAAGAAAPASVPCTYGKGGLYLHA